MSRTQSARLLDYLKEHPGATSLDVTYNCRIVNVTGRISDLREAGHRIDAVRDERGLFRYYVRAPEKYVQTSWIAEE